MIEKEVRGFIQKEKFEDTIKKFSKLLGNAVFSKRLSIAFANYDDLTLETKIRITDGRAEVVQKVGDFTAVDRLEITINLENLSSEQLFELYRTYRNFLKGIDKPMLTLIQHENYVFSNDKFEVKLFRQFGNDEFFAFEVEALVEMKDIELENFCEENNLEIDVKYNDLNSIKVRNSKVNIDLAHIDENILKELIEKYTKNI